MNKSGDFKKTGISSLIFILLIIMMGYIVYASLCGGTTCNASTSLDVINSKPNITNIESIPAVTLVADSTKEINVLFNVTDPNGVADINKSTANATVYKAGETDRYNWTCTNISEQDNTVRFNCSILMQFYDAAGSWTVNVSIQDNSEVWEINDTGVTFTVNTLDDVDIDDTTINWASLAPSSDDNEGDAITFTNKGNQDYASINVTGKNATDGSGNSIASTQFAIDVDAGQTTGQTYLNESMSKEWTGASLNHGVSETETMYTYVDVPEGQVPGTYSSESNWDISFIT